MALSPSPAVDPTAARQAQLVRGIGAVSLTVAAAGAGAMGLDSGFDLPGWVRGLLLAGWLGLAGALVWQWVVKPLSSPLPKARGKPTIGSAARAAFAAVALLTPLGFAPGAGERVRRFLLPWYTPLPDTPFHIVVSSGSPVVARGQPVTLAAYLERVRPNALLPDTAVLVVRSASSKAETREPMTADSSAAFWCVRPAVVGDFDYCVEAGGLRSDWHTVAVADPVNLADGTTLTVRPPEYAEGAVAPRSLPGFRDFEAMPAGRVTAVLRFNRPATEAHLEWRLVGARTEQVAVMTLRLEPDRTGGSAEFTVPGDGVLLLTLTGERGLRTEWRSAVRVTPDAPPRFETVAGVAGTVREARPGDRVPIELAAVDDVRVAAVRVEYQVVGREPDVRSEAVLLPGLRTRRVEGAFAFPLAGKVREGESIRFRVRVSDDRSAPALQLGPQDAVFPPDGWATLRITPAARPLAEQEIFGQRDRVRTRLAAAEAHATEAAKGVAAVRQANPIDGPLAVDHLVRLRAAGEELGLALTELDGVVTETGLTPTLRPFAGDIKTRAADPVRATVPLLKSAEADQSRTGRDKALAAAAARLASALSALSELTARNDALAGSRFDRHRLLELAADQLALAEDAAHEGAKPAELAPRQRDLAARLGQLVTGSDRLRPAVAAAAGQELRALLARAGRLADDQAVLDRAIAETDLRARAARLEDLLRRQRELGERAARFGARTVTAARVARAAPLPRPPFDASADHLAAGKTLDALSEQVRATWELDRLADAFAQAAEARRDRREAARQVAAWQDDLRTRFDDAVRKAGGAAPEEERKRFADEQRAVRDAVERLRTPNPDPAAARAEEAARAALAAACDAFDRKPAEAAAAVKQATAALEKYAEQLPGTADRVKHAKELLDQLRRDQAAIAREADDAIANAPKPKLAERLDALAKNTAELAGRVRALDLPGHEARREAAADAALRAADDLRAGFTADVPVSQQELHRRLDRLRQAADGQAPADDTAAESARLARQLDDAANRLPPRPSADELKPLQQTHRELQRQLAALTAPEYGASVSEVRRSVDDLGTALRLGEPVIDLRRAAKRTADAAAVLADRLGGNETDPQRVARLARERGAAAKPTPEARAAALRDVDRQLEELALVRAGKAASVRQSALEALKRLRQNGGGAGWPALQQAAASALQRFATELAAAEVRTAPGHPAPAPADADDLRTLTGSGRLPTAEAAHVARELARIQSAIHKATSEAVADLARGTRPADRDDLGPLVKEQQEIAALCRGVCAGLSPEDPSFATCTETTDALGRAAASLAAGRIEDGKREAANSEGLLTAAARAVGSKPNLTTRLEFLQKRQSELVARVGRLAVTPAVEAARQHARLNELAADADRLAESFRDADVPADPESPVARALTAMLRSRDELAQAARDAAGERPAASAMARAKAVESLGRVTTALRDAARSAPTRPASAGAAGVGQSLRRASAAMRRSEFLLTRPNGTGDGAASMRAAAEAVSSAANGLTGMMTGPGRD